MKYYPEGFLLNTSENRNTLSSHVQLSDACKDARIIEARAIVCDNQHNMIVDLKCMKGLIPREEGAVGIKEGTVRDIALISRVNKPVCFVIKDFIRDEKGAVMALLSRREAQERCQTEYLSKLRPGDVIAARVTHVESFGVFADIGCGIIALLPIDLISVSRIDHPKERFAAGMDIKCVVRNIDNGRVTLSQKELLGTWIENAMLFSPGETVAGIVRSIESYGIFVELSPNLAGLAEYKENVSVGQQASVYIKSIIPAKMKIKLIIIETFDYTYKATEPRYFIESSHLDVFEYSPPDCEKKITVRF